MGEKRLGDVIDDHCIKCRRVTNHSIVSLVEGEAAKVRCRTCYHDHDYRHEQAPPTKKELKKMEADALAAAEAASAKSDGLSTLAASALALDLPTDEDALPADLSLGDLSLADHALADHALVDHIEDHLEEVPVAEMDPPPPPPNSRSTAVPLNPIAAKANYSPPQ